MLDEGEVVALIRKVCRSRGHRLPSSIIFHTNSGEAHVTYGKGGTICLPTLERIERFKLLGSRDAHVLLVLHEVTHWLVGQDVGHRPDPFYTTLYGLAEEHGLDMDEVYRDEKAYKPRYAVVGRRLYEAVAK